MWREVIAALTADTQPIGDLQPGPDFHPGASLEELDSVERALQVRLPTSLKALLSESNGVQVEFGTHLIWSTDEITSYVRYQLAFLQDEIGTSLQFFGDPGVDGIRFGLLVSAEGEATEEVYAWYPIGNECVWKAASLRKYIERWLGGGLWVGGSSQQSAQAMAQNMHSTECDAASACLGGCSARGLNTPVPAKVLAHNDNDNCPAASAWKGKTMQDPSQQPLDEPVSQQPVIPDEPVVQQRTSGLPLGNPDGIERTSDLPLGNPDGLARTNDLPLGHPDPSEVATSDLPLEHPDGTERTRDLPLEHPDGPRRTDDLPLGHPDASAQRVVGDEAHAHMHPAVTHTHDHYHVSHHHRSGEGLDAFEHRAHYHSHEHNHPAITHAHHHREVETERVEHEQMAHSHDHAHPVDPASH